MSAAARAVTPAAQLRRRALAESYLDRLKTLVRDRPEASEVARRIAALRASEQPLAQCGRETVEWPLPEVAA